MGLEGACSAGHWRAARDWLWPFGRKRISSVTLAEMAVVIPPLRAEMPEKWRTSAPQARQTVAGYLETVGGHPEAELVQDVDGGVDGASDGGAMPFPFAVVFAFGHVNGSGAVKARHAVAGVAVEPGVARLQGNAFRDP